MSGIIITPGINNPLAFLNHIYGRVSKETQNTSLKNAKVGGGRKSEQSGVTQGSGGTPFSACRKELIVREERVNRKGGSAVRVIRKCIRMGGCVCVYVRR